VKPTPSNRRAWFAVSAAVALVVFRSLVFLCYEQNFDSDQAIVGLMAKHLSEFRALPLFFYGQNYMLGVEAWAAVPFFWLGGPTVTMLRMPLLLCNVAVAVLLIRLLTAGGVDPWLALIAALPFAAAGAVASAQLMTALGASVEPLVYVIALWLLRGRPVPFGVVLCLGSLHREFTMFAVPPILAWRWLERREIRWVAVAQAASAFAIVWIAIDQLKRHVNIAGPDAPGAATGSLALEAVQVGRLLSFHPDVYAARLRLLLTQGLPDLFGARPQPLVAAGIWGDGTIGSSLAGAALAAAIALAAARLLWIAWRRRVAGIQPQLFLACVGVEALLAYGLHGGTAIEPRTELNYVLLALLLAPALLGAHFQQERNAPMRRTVAALTIAWALAMTADHARTIREYVVSPPDSIHRTLADDLTTRRIKYAWAGYWDAYRVTFLARERVVVASTETVRIPGYQVRVERNAANAARIVRAPCSGGRRVAEWCVFDPFER